MTLPIGQWAKSSHSNPYQNCVEVRVDFHKSTYSGGGNGSQCIEIALTPAVAYLRDSKNATGPTLRMPAAALAGLVALART